MLEGTRHTTAQTMPTSHMTMLQVAAYEFTTLTCVPGVIRFRGAKIQLLDLPGIIEGAKDGKGRGRQVSTPERERDRVEVQGAQWAGMGLASHQTD